MDYEKFIPLVYLISVAVVAAGLTFLNVPKEMTGLIVGAGLTRIKMPAPSNNTPVQKE